MICSQSIYGLRQFIWGCSVPIRGITDFGHQDEVPMMSALVCIIAHWTRPIGGHDIRLSGSCDFTKLLYCIIFQPWENTELILKLVVTLTYGWDPKVIIYSLWIGSLLLKIASNKYYWHRHHDILETLR